ncbi:hypothetical protein [Algirhabdus cladophorae]|uniref:hypothetical protein n=1 Tax=Algirhabdus cladophorae TaxID=3377108 RepID=UPI003B849C4D
MPILGFRGFPKGQSVTLQATQDGVATLPLTAASWDATGSGLQGGPVTIKLDRTQAMAAPDSVRFSVELDKTTFGLPAGNSTAYDQGLHELIYLWDFGEDAPDAVVRKQWDAPQNIFDKWKTRSCAKGPWVSHVYRTPNTYTASVIVLNPRTGQSSTASATFQVGTLDAFYPAGNTICVNPIGDPDFGDAPLNAQHVNADALLNDDALWTDQRGGDPVRWLFKRGGSFTLGVSFDSSEPHDNAFGAYGSGEDPIITSPTDGTNGNRCFYVNARYVGLSGNKTPDLRIFGLNFQGNHDPTVEEQTIDATNKTSNALRSDKYLDIVIHKCRFAGFFYSAVSTYPRDLNEPHNVHLDDVVITDFGGQYPTIFGEHTHPQSSVSLTGTRIAQNPEAFSDPGIRAPSRIQSITQLHMRGCDIFHTDETQPCIKFQETPHADGMITNVHSNSFEGGLEVISLNRNATNSYTTTAGRDGGAINNAIFDGNVFVGNYRSMVFARLEGQGVTYRGNLCIMPATVRTGSGLEALFFVFNRGDEPTTQSAPIDIYNNTFVLLRTSEQNNALSPIDFSYNQQAEYLGNPDHDDVNFNNNIRHYPNLDSPVTPYAPLDRTPEVMWTPRNIGRKALGQTTVDPLNGAPQVPLDAYAPSFASPALGDAMTEPVSYFDMFLAQRPEPPSKGAWEAQ